MRLQLPATHTARGITINDTLVRHRNVVFLALALALIAAVGYGLAHRPADLVFVVIPPQPTPLATPTPTDAPVACHVTGAVVNPGVYTLQPGALIQDAVRMAGGPLAEADLGGLNLAAVVQDQQQIVVPRRLPDLPPNSTDVTKRPLAGLTYVNTASSEALQALPGIGPVLAERIIDYRDEHGAFIELEDLLEVNGIGTHTLETLRPLITVDP